MNRYVVVQNDVFLLSILVWSSRLYANAFFPNERNKEASLLFSSVLFPFLNKSTKSILPHFLLCFAYALLLSVESRFFMPSFFLHFYYLNVFFTYLFVPFHPVSPSPSSFFVYLYLERQFLIFGFCFVLCCKIQSYLKTSSAWVLVWWIRSEKNNKMK